MDLSHPDSDFVTSSAADTAATTAAVFASSGPTTEAASGEKAQVSTTTKYTKSLKGGQQ